MRYAVEQRGVAEAVAISTLRDHFLVEIRYRSLAWIPDPRAVERPVPVRRGRKRRRNGVTARVAPVRATATARRGSG